MKKTTRIFGILLIAAMLLGAFGITAFAADAEDLTVTIDTGASITLKDTDGDGYYDIGTADELYAFAALVNEGNTTINGELTADITVNENVLNDDGSLNGTPSRVWTPIGNTSVFYTGIFDGANRTVCGLYLNKTDNTYVALFGRVEIGGTVKNVGVVDSYFSGSNAVGGVVGFNYGTVTNCYNAGSVTYNGQYPPVGGVVGLNYGTVENCYNTGSVSGSSNVGGVVGYAPGGTVANCYNTGNVSGSSNVGGVVGYAPGGTVANCYNTGSVSGSSNVGGVVGYAPNGTIANCYNTGSVSGSSDVGGVVGYAPGGKVGNCYYLAESETDSIDGTTFKNFDQFKSGEVAWLLSEGCTMDVFAGYDEFDDEITEPKTFSGEAWKQTLSTDAYPNFTGAVVSCYATNGYCNHVFDSTSGKCPGCQTLIAVASVTIGDVTTYYETADDAFTAAKAAGSGIVTILQDAAISTMQLLNSYSEIDLVVTSGKTLTLKSWLYFNGDISGGGTIADSALVTYENSTFRDCIVNSTMENNGTIYSGTFNGNVTNNGTIDGGTFNGEVENCGTVNGGTFNSIFYNYRQGFKGGTVNNTTAGTFLLGDNFAISNSYDYWDAFWGPVTIEGVINCTAHIWEDGECRLCDKACEHTAEPVYTINKTDPTQHDITYSCCDGVAKTEMHGEYSYTAAADKITVKCGHCDYAADLRVCASDVEYNGERRPASVEGSVAGISPEIVYKQGDDVLEGAPTNAGVYSASISLGGVTASVDFTISPANITNATVVVNETRTYDGTEQKPTTLQVGLNGVFLTANDYEIKGYSNNVNAGTATITIAGKGNYIGEASGSFTIEKADAEYTAPTAIENLVYNGQLQNLINTGSTEHGTIKYFVKNTFGIINIKDEDYFTETPSCTDVGTYIVYYKLFGDENHNDASGSIMVKIGKATPILTVTSPISQVLSGNKVLLSATATYGDLTDLPTAFVITSATNATWDGMVITVADGLVIGQDTVTVTVSSVETENYNAASYTITLNVGMADYSAAITELEAAIAALEKTVAEGDAANDEALTQAIADLTEAIEAAEAAAKTYTDEKADELAKMIAQAQDTLEAALEALEDRVEKNETDIAQLQTDLQKAIEELEKAIAEGDAANAEALAQAIADLTEAIEAAEAAAKTYTDEKADELAKMIAQAQDTLEAALEALEDRVEKNETDIAQLQTDLQKAIAALEKTVAEGDAANAEALAQAIADLTEAIEAAEAAAKTYTDEKADELAKMIAQAQDTLEVALIALEDRVEKNETDIAQLQTDLQKAIEELEKAIAAGDTALEEKLAEEVAALEDQLKAAVEELKDLISAAETAANAYTDEMATELAKAIAQAQSTLEVALKALEARVEKNETDIAQLQTDLQKAIEELEKAIAEGDAVNAEALAQAIIELTEAIEAAEAAAAAEDTAIRSELAAARASLNSAIDKVAADLAQAKSDLEAAIANGDTALDEKITALNNALTSAQAALEAADAANKAELEGKIATAQTALQTAIDKVAADLAQAKSDLEAAIANGDTALDEKITALNNALTSAQAALEAADAANKAELEGKIAAAQTALQTAIDKVAADLAQAKSDLEAAIANGDTALDNKIAALNAALDSAISAYQAADRSLRAELTSAISNASATLNAAIEKVASDLAEAEKELAEAISNGDAALSGRISSVSAALNAARTALEKADADNKAALEEIIAGTEATLDAAIKVVQKNLDDAKAELSKAIVDGDAALDSKIAALSDALASAKAALEAADAAYKSELTAKIDEAYAAVDAAVKALREDLEEVKAQLEKADADNKAALEAKDSELQTFIIVVCVISGLAFCGCATVAVFYFIIDKKKI